MPRPSPSPEDLALEDWLLLPVIALLPWAFGGVEMWAYRAASLGIVAAVRVVLWKYGPKGLGLGQGDERWQLAAFALAAWAFVQIVPLPPQVIRIISPHAHQIYTEILPGYPGQRSAQMLAGLERKAIEHTDAPADVAAAAVDQRDIDCGGPWRPISLHPAATEEQLFWYLCLLGAFLVVRNRATSPERESVYRWTCFATFAALAVFGLLQSFQWTGAIYWMRPVLVDSRPFGPYVNPNHFAGLMELAVPWLAGYTWSRLKEATQKPFQQPARFVLAGAGTVACLTAGLASASKAGAVLLPAGLLCVALFGARTGRLRLRIGLVAIALIAVLAVALASTTVGERIRSHLDKAEGLDVAGGRVTAWSSATGMLRDYPLTGIGFGAFGDVYPHYLPPGEFKGWSQLHNDYYEVLVSGGIVAALLVGALVWGYVSRLRAQLFPRGSPISQSDLGLVVGLAALAVHGFADFNHQIPANALMFVALAALALPLADEPVLLAGKAIGRQRRWILPAAAVVLVLFAVRAATGFVSGVAFARAAIALHDDHEGDALPLLRIAARGESQFGATREMAATRVRLWDEQTMRDGYKVTGTDSLERSARDYARCVCLSPASWRPFEGLARIYHRLELVRREAAPATTDGPVALGYPAWVAIGMQHVASSQAPNWHTPYDRLAVMLREYGLQQQSLDVIRRSAALLPLYPRAPFETETDPAFLAAFAEGAWKGISESKELDRAPYRISLARLEEFRGEHARAIEMLESVLERKHDAAERAEVEMLLGEAHMSLGHYEESLAHLQEAARHPLLEAPAIGLLVRLARARGRVEDELEALNRLRTLRPDDVTVNLEHAAAASRLERWSVAQASIRRAKLLDPDDPRPHLALIELYLAQKQTNEAASELDVFETKFGRTPEAAALHNRIEALRPRG